MTSQPFLTIAEKTDLLFRRMRKPNGKRYTYGDVIGPSNSSVSRLRLGRQEEPFFWVIQSVARTFGIPLAYFSHDLTLEAANEFLDRVEDRPRRLKEEEKVRLDTADILAQLAVRCAQMPPEDVTRLRAWLDEILPRLDLSLP